MGHFATIEIARSGKRGWQKIMTRARTGPVTQLLHAVGGGDEHAQAELWALVYDELRAIAGRQMAGDRGTVSLQPTALVHEAYFRLVGEQNGPWNGRGHFFAAAAEAMRRIRVDDARRRKRLKRGGGAKAEALGAAAGAFDQDPAELLAVDEALTELACLEPRKAEIVKLRYYAGLTIEETAEALGLSTRTINNEWRVAKAWLHRALASGDTTNA